MSDISLQRYKARRAFQSLKEDKHMDNSEYIKLKSVIQNVKETRNDVVEEAAVVDPVVVVPQNFVYVFIVDSTFDFSTEDIESSSDRETDPPLRYITSVTVDDTGSSGVQPYVSDTEQMIDHRGDGSTLYEDMIMNFDLLLNTSDTTNVYHYIKIIIPTLSLNVIDTDTFATAISDAIDKSVTKSLTSGYDTIIKRVIVGYGVNDIKTAYNGFVNDVSFSVGTYSEYSSYVDGLATSPGSYHLIAYVQQIIEEINDSYETGDLAGTLAAEYEPSNTIVLYPNNNYTVTVDGDTTDYNVNASIFFRLKMKEQNVTRGYTLLYTEWSRVIGIEYAPSGTIYSDTNVLKAATLSSLGGELAGIVGL